VNGLALSGRVAVTASRAVAAVAIVLHVWAGYALPRPWPDESHFITPALALLDGAGLSVPELNAPQGIFWMPSGYYVAQAPLLAVGMDPLAAARLLSLLGVVVFAVTLASAAVRAGVHWIASFGAVLVWLCMPRVVTIANIARMEGLVLALTGVALWCIALDRWRLAAAAAWLAPLVHPIGLVVAVAVSAAAIVRAPSQPWSRLERGAVGLVGLLWVAQIAYFLAHADLAGAHLGFQLTRKAGRAITLQWWQWAALLLAAGGGLLATLRARRGDVQLRIVWTLLALAGGFVVIDVVGREMWYEFVGRETVVLVLVLAALGSLRRADRLRTSGRALVVGLGVVAALGSVIAVRQTLTTTWYGMRGDVSSRSEWVTFVDTAMGELARFDAQAGQAATVVVDPLSGIGQEIFARDWQHLTFVQPTPATPLPPTAGDYVLATPGAPFVTASLVDPLAAKPPALEIRSRDGTFVMQLFDRTPP
jgi:hypothetical protein